jgi:hypothetical protein
MNPLRNASALLALALFPAMLCGQNQAPTAAFKTLVADYQLWQEKYLALTRKAASNEERQRLFDQVFAKEQVQFAQRFLDLARKNPGDAAAIESLAWVVVNSLGNADLVMLRSQAIDLLRTDHLQNSTLDRIFPLLTDVPSLEGELLLRTAMEKSPHRTVQGRGGFHLGRYFKVQAEIVRQLQFQPALAGNVEPYCGPELTRRLLKSFPDQLSAEAEKIFQRVADQYSLVRQDNSTLGKLVETELYELRHLSYGRTAPEIQGEDIDGKSFKLSDYRGKVVVISFWGNW